jgi:steroid 5-alpha reductase family enzyme
VTGAILGRLAEAWAIAAAIQLTLWLVQQRTRNAGIVDVGWAGSFLPVVAWLAIRAEAPASAWGPIALVVALWSARLTAYLVARGAAHSPEEGRYVELRARWGARAGARFFVFFQAQAALVAVLSSAFVVPFLAAPDPDWAWLCTAGAAIAAVGIAGEATADAQLARWKRDPRHRGAVCAVGLWGYSRHPNYFFEWCVWIGYAVYGFAFAPWGLIALAGQAIIVASIFGVTGIPPTEAQAIRSKGDAYRDYQRRVSRFVPWPPKRDA